MSVVSYVWTTGSEVPHVVKGTPADVYDAFQRGVLDCWVYDHHGNGTGVASRLLSPGLTALEGYHGEPLLIRGAHVTAITTEADLPW